MHYIFLLTALLLISPVHLQDSSCPDGVSISLTEPASVLENGLASFTCTVNVPSQTTLPSQVSWLKDYLQLDTSRSRFQIDYVPISDTQVEFKLEILTAEVEDTGIYSCDPALPGVLCRASVNLTVNYALAVIVEDQDALTGADAELLCLIRGDNPSVVWYRYNETSSEYTELDSDSGKYSFSQVGNEFFLSFSSVSSEDTGVYRCLGRSPSGTVFEDFNFYSLVAPSDTQIIGGNEGKFYGFSEMDLTLTCAAEGVRAPQYNWTINNIKLEENTDKLIFNRSSGELMIVGATKFDEGTYTCEAYNKAGTQTAQVVVMIHIAATITSQVRAVNVGLGGKANITCSLSASPPINTVQWVMSTSTQLTNSSKYRFYYNGTLIISDIDGEDDTTYQLKVCNTILTRIYCAQSQLINVLVTFPAPAPTNLAIESENTEARTVEISWINPTTSTRDIPEFYVLEVSTYKTDGFIILDEEIPVSSYSGFTITKFFPGYRNFFRLRGSNLGGLGEPSNELNVSLSASVPRIRSVSVTVVSSTSLNVTYELWHDGGKPLTELKVEYKENSSSTWIEEVESFEDKNATYYYVITDLTSATYYNIRVQVRNELGASGYFEPEEKLLPNSLPGAPVIAELETRLDSVRISITLDDFGTGRLLGFFIKYVLGTNETIEEISVEDLGVVIGEPFIREIAGLESEVTYTFSAAANSTIGLGPYSREINIYTDSPFFDSLYFKIFVGVAGLLVIIVLLLLCLALCMACCCFRYGKKRQYFQIQKSSNKGAENFALTEDGPDINELSTAGIPKTRPLPKDDGFSETSTPPVPPRLSKDDLMDEVHAYHPSPPLAGYTSVKDPQHRMPYPDYRSDPFGDFPINKNFMGQDRQPTHSLGNVSQGSFITDV